MKSQIKKGYETTSSALTYCAYVLTRYPEEQTKVFEEIDEFYGDSMVLKYSMCFLKNSISRCLFFF